MKNISNKIIGVLVVIALILCGLIIKQCYDNSKSIKEENTVANNTESSKEKVTNDNDDNNVKEKECSRCGKFTKYVYLETYDGRTGYVCKDCKDEIESETEDNSDSEEDLPSGSDNAPDDEYYESQQQSSITINDVINELQQEFNNSGFEATVSHGVDCNNKDVIEIYANSGITQQEVQILKDTIGTQAYKNQMKEELNNSTNVQDMIDAEQELNDYGIHAYIRAHIVYSDARSLNLAFYTVSTGWIVL